MYNVYLIHFNRKLHHAGHYVGTTSDLVTRIKQHRQGNGARLMEVLHDLGTTWIVTRIWSVPTDKAAYRLERRIKGWHNHNLLCPLCDPLAFNHLNEYPSHTPVKGELQ